MKIIGILSLVEINKGWKTLQISSRFLADLKALADFPRKIKEFERGSKEG